MRKLFFILLFMISPCQEESQGSAPATTLDEVINPVKKAVSYGASKILVVDVNPF